MLFYPRKHVKAFTKATNAYAKAELERKATSRTRSLCWKSLSTKEIYVFLGILIHMSSNKKPKIIDYWRTPRGPLNTPLGIERYISLKRFQALFKLFTVSPHSADNDNEIPRAPPTPYYKSKARRKRVSEGPPGPAAQNYWWKVKPLATHIRKTCMRVYISSTHVTIDEVMLAFRGRFKDTTKLKSKPIKEGYKNWVLADHGYVWG